MSQAIEITDQDIIKALDTLGLNNKTTDEITKGEGSDKEPEEKEQKETPKEKEEDKKQTSTDDEDEDEEAFEKAMCEIKKAFPKKSSKFFEKPIEKSVETDILKSFNLEENDIIKSFVEKFDATTTLFKSMREENDILKKSLETLTEEVQKIGNQSTGSKSLRSVNAIEKSFGGESVADGKIAMSVGQQKDQIVARLYNLANIEKGEVNQFWANETMLFESSSQMSPTAMQKLFSEHSIQIVP